MYRLVAAFSCFEIEQLADLNTECTLRVAHSINLQAGVAYVHEQPTRRTSRMQQQSSNKAAMYHNLPMDPFLRRSVLEFWCIPVATCQGMT